MDTDNPMTAKCITRLYVAFRRRLLPLDVDAQVRKKPVREFTTSELNDIISNGRIDLGNSLHFKHFLPRILELASRGEWSEPPEVFMSKLTPELWNSLRRVERSAVINFFVAVWYELLSNISYPVSADSWLCANSQLVVPLSRFLNQWYFDWWHEDSSRLRHLGRFLELNFDAINTRRELFNHCWTANHKKAEDVLGWLGNNHEKLVMIYRNHHACSFARDSDSIADRFPNIFKTYWEARGYKYDQANGVSEEALRKSISDALKAPDPYSIVSAARAPLSQILDSGYAEWYAAENDRFLSIICDEPHAIRRQDGLWHLLIEKAPKVEYIKVVNLFKEACSEARGGKTFINLKYVSLRTNAVDHDAAIELALLIKHPRTRRQVLRLIGESDLANQ